MDEQNGNCGFSGPQVVRIFCPMAGIWGCHGGRRLTLSSVMWKLRRICIVKIYYAIVIAFSPWLWLLGEDHTQATPFREAGIVFTVASSTNKQNSDTASVCALSRLFCLLSHLRRVLFTVNGVHAANRRYQWICWTAGTLPGLCASVSFVLSRRPSPCNLLEIRIFVDKWHAHVLLFR